MTAELERVGTASGPELAGPPGRIAPGTALAGRYTVERLVRRSSFAEVYQAAGADGNPVSVHLLHEQWTARPELTNLMLEGVRRAAGLEHKNIARTLEVLTDGPGPCVVTEYLEGAPLRDLLAQSRQSGSPGFGARAASNIIGGVCNALTAAHIDMAHGAIGPDSVYVNSAGRVKVTDFGLAAAVPAAVRAGATAPPHMAPEVAAAGEPSRAGDVFAVGALLYELLVGEPLRKGGRRPSQAAEVAPAVDQLVARCCVPQPGQRPADAATVKAAATQALKLPSGQRAAAKAPAAAAPAAAQPGPAGADALRDDEEKWLISKGKLDYGPFSMADVVEQIRTDDILPGHLIMDNHTGARCPVEDHPLLGQLVDQAKQARDDRRRAQAEVSHARQESRRGVALYGFVGAGVLALAVAAYFIVQKVQDEETTTERGGIAAIEEGQLQPQFSFPEPKKRTSSKRGSRGSSRGASRGGGGGGDEVLDFDDDVGSERLDNAEVTSIIQRNGGRLGGCLQRNGGGFARITFQIKGKTGKVYSVKVNDQQSGALYQCLNKAMRAMKFPTFDGLRSGHEFEMSL